ncbi:MAG: carotenoid 1,2-hydratase [Planctomycetes bacterium]|nr:carotenoid 1,2-hydratase [Planctomycetota bacterium]MBI3844315.1 carotenoid 1,2-hydratase [Planctomycetota bacterium]
MKKTSPIAALLAVSLCTLGCGRAEEWDVAKPGRTFHFPDDHFAHDRFKTEWWYYTGHLGAASGERFGYQVTFFRRGVDEADAAPDASAWAVRHLYAAHVAVCDEKRETFTFAEKVGRAALGRAGAAADRYLVWLDDWRAAGLGRVHHVTGGDERYRVDLALTPEKPPAVHGQGGVSQKGDGIGRASHYYSMTRLRTEGVLAVDGNPLAVTGLSWMDHEFGSNQLADDQVGWDWFSVQLDDGADLMVYRMRKQDGSVDRNSSGSFVAPDGAVIPLSLDDVSVEAKGTWKSPRSGATYPSGWRVAVAKRGLDLAIEPVLADQELDAKKSTGIVYWEGAVRITGTSAGKPVRGQGYVELVGYAAPFREKI